MTLSPTNRRLGVVLGSVALAGGVAGELLAPGQPRASADILCGLVTLGIIFAWYRADSGKLGYRRTPILNTMVLGLAIIAVPYYLFRSRGLAGGSRATAVFVLIVVVYSLLSWLGAYAAYYARAI